MIMQQLNHISKMALATILFYPLSSNWKPQEVALEYS